MCLHRQAGLVLLAKLELTSSMPANVSLNLLIINNALVTCIA